MKPTSPPVADGSLRGRGVFRGVNERARCSMSKLRKAFCACRSQSQSTAGDRSCTCLSPRLSSGHIGQSCRLPVHAGGGGEGYEGRGGGGGQQRQRARRRDHALTPGRGSNQCFSSSFESRGASLNLRSARSGCLLRRRATLQRRLIYRSRYLRSNSCADGTSSSRIARMPSSCETQGELACLNRTNIPRERTHLRSIGELVQLDRAGHSHPRHEA